MEEFLVQPLSEGLGFYEKSLAFDRMEKTKEKPSLEEEKPVCRQKLDSLPEDFLPEKWDPQKKGAYNALRAVLEKPYLSETEGRPVGSSWNNYLDVPVLVPQNPYQQNSRTDSVPHARKAREHITENWRNKSSAPHARDARDPYPQIADNLAQSPDRQSKIQVNARSTAHSLDFRRQLLGQKVNTRSTAHSPFRKIFHSWTKATLVDVLTASFFFFPPFILFMLLTEVVSMSVLNLLWPQILFAFLCFVQMYCLLCRLFCFETYGEALAKMRLSPVRSKGPAHPLSLFWRFLLSCSTGFVFLPMLSLILKKDVAGYLTGLHFQKTPA